MGRERRRGESDRDEGVVTMGGGRRSSKDRGGGQAGQEGRREEDVVEASSTIAVMEGKGRGGRVQVAKRVRQEGEVEGEKVGRVKVGGRSRGRGTEAITGRVGGKV